MANVLGAAQAPAMAMDERVHHLFGRIPDAHVHLYGKGSVPDARSVTSTCWAMTSQWCGNAPNARHTGCHTRNGRMARRDDAERSDEEERRNGVEP